MNSDEPKADGNNNFETSKQWAAKAYTALQSVITNKNLVIITHDSFMGPKNFIPIAQQLGTSTTFGVDQHNYQLYTDADNVKDQKQHIASACDWAKDLAETKAAMPVYVGEWSALTNVCVNPDGSTFASKDCGSAQSSVSDPSGWSKQTVEVVRRYIEAQLDVFERNTQGQFIWSYGGPGGWGVENLIQAGAYPKNGERLYPGQCSS